ncbi:sensor histidine kinase [Schleiferilactobacillus harbinensis]|uniref:sensor histidine kinase n=1 Tax=Schleiferilactobacillus harbinensis TaxID=304207 RepID=UPI00288A9704|nr:GHKL domain-containing protein [Schleiferilactobacillus harbinensis]
MIGQLLWCTLFFTLGGLLWLSAHPEKKPWWSGLALIPIATLPFIIPWGGILAALLILGLYAWLGRDPLHARWPDMVLGGLLVLAALAPIWLSLPKSAAGLFTIVIGACIVHIARGQTFRPLWLLLSGTGAIFAVLFFISDTPARFLLLGLWLLTVKLVTGLLTYLFQQTDMVYAQSLDGIMANYIKEVNDLYAQIRGWRHDYHDHLQSLKVYLHDGDVAQAQHYLSELETSLGDIEQIVRSGNPMLDAVLNAKLTMAKNQQIPMNVKAFVGPQPLIKDVDLVVILGNILDNALEAIEAQPATDDRFLRVYIAIMKQQLYISVTNTRPADQYINYDYASTKNDKRGLGIRRINALVEKYNGMINRQYEEGVFVTEIALPLPTISQKAAASTD